MARKPKKIVFEEPILVGGKELKEVEMRAPKGKDIQAISHITSVFERDCILVSNLCDMNATIDDFKEMDAAEVQQLRGELADFLGSGLMRLLQSQQK